MTKQEVIKFTKKISNYYQQFTINDEDVINEWIEKLEPYSIEDLEKRFNEHLNSKYAMSPPLLHILIKDLPTTEQKKYTTNDLIIRCDLCGKEMYLSHYNKEHRKKCLLINALIPVLNNKGENVEYDDLNQYDFLTLDRIYEKYVPIKKDIKEVIKGAF